MIFLYYALLLLLPIVLSSGQQLVRNEDICGPHNGRRLYVELGERGVLRADNVSLVKNSPQLQQDSGGASGNNNNGGRPLYATTNSSHDQCSLELVTCPSCVISVVFRSINLQHHCGDGGATVDSPCRCDYVWISEPPYEDVSGTPFCGHYAPMAHRSNTRTLSIALLYSQSHSHAFSLEYTAERNRLILTGSNSMNDIAKSMNNTGGGTLASPFFPSRYPRDMGIEYIISCPTEAPVCRVRVLFSDFQVAAVSVMEFYDWNGQRLDVSSGARFRPPIIVSTGPSLLVRFYANGGTGLGYKAFYSFVFTDPAAAGGLATVQPVTDCGGYVENLGGTITMMDMVGDEGVRTYDCVWLIKPPKNFLHTKTHMYVKVISFAEMAGNTELIIKQGPTSALMPLEVLRHPVSQLQPPKLREHLAPVSNGFHVSLRGSFGPNSRLAIAYAAFSYIDCFAGSDFLCQNHRCISSQLNCDGFDHCGDSSDEPATCMHDMDMTIKDQKWHQSKANYYFPKIDRYPDLKTATMVFVISSLGLIIMISTLIIMLYRIGSRARQQRELQSRLRTISELLDGARIDEMSVNADEPPVYEAPPNYDEVIKLGMENETAAAAAARRKRARRTPSAGGGRRSRSVPSQCSCEFESHLTINAYEGPSNGNLGSDAPQSASSSSSTTAILPAGSESPPPPYVTPPKPASPIFRSDDNPQPGPSGLSSHVASSSPSSRSEANCRGTCRHRLERRNSSVSLPAASREASTERLTQNDDDDLLQQQQRIETSENVLGAYNASSSSSPAAPADACAAPQLPRSSAASACTSTECADTCCSADVDTRIEAPVRRGRGPPQPANVDASRVEGCLCEGACGCASLKRARALLRSVGASKTIDHEPEVDPTTTTMTRTLTSPNVSAVTQAQRQRRQLFFAVDDKNQADETTNILDRVPSSSSSSTCLKKNYASCDLDNLYESIKVLDTYLAKRTATSQDRLGQLAKRRRSMAAMLFDDDLRQPSEDDAVFSTPMTMSRRESRDNEPRP
ncbi:uncharacterized protein LOC106659961 isoform X2 [Trichogramma pretiosum]|uniref:uncharacterized protein LOC106659961 isoform X2 n=1 Tax=Trichogramma pretiosum TaxID=7493 RepID=UPI0006C9D3D1|nr:uncharacterized protein LOC106659961 isoform X2 [Trichogramma pretiosum]